MLGRYVVYAANLASMMVLARLFSPDTFGTVAAMTVFFTFFQLIAQAGLGPAIINLDELTTQDRNGLFGLTLTVGILLGALFAALEPVFLGFYGLPRVDEVVPFIAVGVLFFSASIVPTAFLLRQQAFYRIANAGLAAEVVSTCVTVGLMHVIDPLHALASKGAASAITIFILSWYFSRGTEFGCPMPGTRFSAIKPLLGFSGYQFGFNFINYFSRNLDNILIGKFMGAGALGVYDKSYQLMRYPLMLLTFAMTPAIQPVIRKYVGDPVRVEAIHRDFTFKLSLIGATAGLLMFLLAEIIVYIMLGNQWLEVIPIIKILAIAVPVQVVLSTSGSFFQAMNRAGILFLSGTLSAVVMVGAIVIGVIQENIQLLCWYLVGAFHINFVQAYYYLYRKVFDAPLRWHMFRMVPASLVVVGMIGWISINGV
jgi:O-antigen/teichoic acid export membrane protein